MATTLAACSVDNAKEDPTAAQGYYYTGYVYDGVSAQALTKYELTLSYNAAATAYNTTGEGGSGGSTEVELKASVDKNGYYHVGPLKPGSDFTVEISADGYRPFQSINLAKGQLPTSTPSLQETALYEAYLFPDSKSLVTPEVTFSLFASNGAMARPSGKVRIVPGNLDTGALNLSGTLGSAINNHLWSNTLDRHEATKVYDLTDGELTIPSGDLVYGVTYAAVVYSTDGLGYQTFNFTAGLSGSQSVILNELSETALAYVGSSLTDDPISSTGSVTFTFNRDIEFGRNTTETVYAEAIDNGVSITHEPGSGTVTLATNASPSVQEHGTHIKISGKTLTLSWDNAVANYAAGFDPTTKGETVTAVRWSNFASIDLVAVGAADSTTTDLATLVNANYIDVRMAKIAP